MKNEIFVYSGIRINNRHDQQKVIEHLRSFDDRTEVLRYDIF